MEIKNESVNAHGFDAIKVGDVFRCNNVFYMKTSSAHERNILLNAVSLTDGALVGFHDNDEVTAVNGCFMVG